MNVFVLCTGRCGSLTFSKACAHMANFTASHESRIGVVGDGRLDYPEDHIEVDNRLTWLLGRLDERYGPAARYVHLTRNREETATSFLQRFTPAGIMTAYSKGILMGSPASTPTIDFCLDYVDTASANIRCFLKDKEWVPVRLEEARDDFRRFWHWIGARGDIEGAIAEWDMLHNAST